MGPKRQAQSPTDGKCRLCKKLIEPGAIKCTECDGYQNWRRYFDFSSVILSLLIALFSVLAVVIPVAISALTSQSSDVQLAEIRRDRDSITFVCSNRGNRTAIIYSCDLVSASEATQWHLPLPDSKLVLHAGDVVILTLKPSIGNNFVPFPDDAAKIEFRLVPFGREPAVVSQKLKK